MDYYQILQVDRTDAVAKIISAYRKLALKWHPQKHPKDVKKAEVEFKEISEAFDVLRDSEKRAFYNKFGEQGLKQSASIFTFTDPYLLFKEYFGDSNPFASKYNAIADRQKVTGNDVVYELNHPLTKAAPIEKEFECTLQDLFKGCEKKVNYTRKRYNLDKITTSEVTTTFSISVKPGWVDGHTIKFPGEADEGPGMIPTDVIYTLKTLPDKKFRREGDNLVYVMRVTLKQALLGLTIVLETLDYRTLRLAVNEIIRPGYERVVKGEGMPKEAGEGRGDLIIRFRTTFPRKLSKKQMDALGKIL